MTFAEARTILRNDVLAEASTEYYSDDALLDFLLRSAKELAMSFGFPTALGIASISVNQSTFSLPADAEQVDLNEVSFGAWRLMLAPYRTILSALNQTSLGVPRYYNYDPKRGGTVQFAPKAHTAGTMYFEYVQKYDTSALTSASEVWGGLFPAFHELVVYRAAVKAFDASLETDKAGYWKQREQAMAQEFSAFLGKTPLHKLVVPEGGES